MHMQVHYGHLYGASADTRHRGKDSGHRAHGGPALRVPDLVSHVFLLHIVVIREATFTGAVAGFHRELGVEDHLGPAVHQDQREDHGQRRIADVGRCHDSGDGAYDGRDLQKEPQPYVGYAFVHIDGRGAYRRGHYADEADGGGILRRETVEDHQNGDDQHSSAYPEEGAHNSR